MNIQSKVSNSVWTKIHPKFVKKKHILWKPKNRISTARGLSASADCAWPVKPLNAAWGLVAIEISIDPYHLFEAPMCLPSHRHPVLEATSWEPGLHIEKRGVTDTPVRHLAVLPWSWLVTCSASADSRFRTGWTSQCEKHDIIEKWTSPQPLFEDLMGMKIKTPFKLWFF